MYFNLKHLKEAKIKAGKPNAGYWWHFRLAMNEADNVGGVSGRTAENTEISLALAF